MLRSTLTLAASVLALSANAAEEQYNLDPAHTYPHFAVSHVGFSTMYGRFDATTGTLTMDRAAKTLSVSVEIEAKSIGTGHAKRDDHLRSPDFFNVAEHPTLTFKSTGSRWEGDRPVEISGDLTLVGVTRPVTLAASQHFLTSSKVLSTSASSGSPPMCFPPRIGPATSTRCSS